MAQLRGLLKDRVQEAYLFGSHALDRASLNSDIDLMLIMDTDRPWTERRREFDDLLDEFGAVDLLVYTPEEWASIEQSPTPFFRQAQRERVRVI